MFQMTLSYESLLEKAHLKNKRKEDNYDKNCY